jgi:hypothetical protein
MSIQLWIRGKNDPPNDTRTGSELAKRGKRRPCDPSQGRRRKMTICGAAGSWREKRLYSLTVYRGKSKISGMLLLKIWRSLALLPLVGDATLVMSPREKLLGTPPSHQGSMTNLNA